MAKARVLEGKYINMRPVEIDDAEFIVSIRNDEKKNGYVHAVSTDVSLQEDWIRRQQERADDYYFIIENKEGKKLGLASIYDVDSKKKQAEFGRWVSWGDPIRNVESVILSFDFAFNELDVDEVYMQTMVANKSVTSFWKNFGVEVKGELVKDGLLLEKEVVTKERYIEELRKKNTKLLMY